MLAGFWAIDALLQLQPSNFTQDLVFGTILGNAEHQPQPIFGSLVTAARLLGPYPAELNVAIIAIQLTLAAGLLYPRTVKLALGLSVPWALGVWWLGEGFGGLFAGKATLLVGAPGAAALYVLLALIAWPRERTPGGLITASGALGDTATARAWALLWVGGAILRVVPFWFAPVYALTADLQLGLDEEPRWILHINTALSHLAASAGLPLVIALAVVEAAIGVGVLTRHRRAALSAGIVVSAVYWAIGQQFAGLLTGSATDIGTGPLYILLALSVWPAGSPGEPSRRPDQRLRLSERRTIP